MNSEMTLADYALKVANAKKNHTKFVILDGSTSVGRDRKYSDYDVMIVTKGRRDAIPQTKEIYGVFNGRLFTGSVQSLESLKEYWFSNGDKEDVWRIQQIRKAKLLCGDETEFRRIKKFALQKRWNKKREFAIIRHSYSNMVEYLGKLLNKRNEENAPEFYQDAYIIASQIASFITAINRINLDSDNTMYRQIFKEAKIRPPNFERDFLILSGFSQRTREKENIIRTAKRIIEWARKYAESEYRNFPLNDFGFREIVQQLKF